MSSPLVSLCGISKHFGQIAANQDIDLDIYPGRIHALLGENGAGKSTLMSILSGRFRADQGKILVAEKPVVFKNPADALRHGIGMVYQRFMLIHPMTVADNLRLALSAGGKKMPGNEALKKTAEAHGLLVDPTRYVFELSMGERQRVEILKLLLLDAKVLIFDEPTAVLTPPEIESFFQMQSRLREADKGIVFITHKLEEVIRQADDISIMRKGKIFASRLTSQGISKTQLARLMVGREVVLRVEKEEIPPGGTVLATRNFSGGAKDSVPFTDINLEVRQGEILAITGVAGNGQEALVAALAGLAQGDGGSLAFAGQEYTASAWARAAKDGIAYVPEDRYHKGSVGALSLAENYALTRLAEMTCQHTGLLDQKRMEEEGKKAVADYRIRAESAAAPAHSLSGGNLQKLILARELARNPCLFLAEQPTQGLDIAATEDIWRALLDCRHHAAVILVTGDLKEVLSLADRIAVMFRGKILATIEAKDPEAINRIGLLMAGVEQ